MNEYKKHNLYIIHHISHIILSFLEKLKVRWDVKNNWQVLIIFLVFALTGFSAMYVKIPIYAFLGITPETPLLTRIGVWLATVFPAYQILLLFYGFLLGQFTFFWNFEKRMFGRIFGLFGGKKEEKN